MTILHKVKMLKSVPGSPNGLKTQFYMKGYVYEIPESLFLSFVDLGVIEQVDEPQEEKAETVPKNRMRAGAPENKGKQKAPQELNAEGFIKI